MQRFVDVTDEVQKVGFCCRVLMTEEVWQSCCLRTELDNARLCYQEQDARVWDVLFVPATRLTMEIGNGHTEQELLRPPGFRYQIYGVIRGGDEDATLITLRIWSSTFNGEEHGLIVTFPDDPL